MKKFVISIIIGFTCLLLSMAITIQFRYTNTSESSMSQEKITAGLKDQVMQLNSKNTELNKKLEETTTNLASIRKEVSNNDDSSKTISNMINKYTIFCGETDITSEGVIIEYIPSKEEDANAITEDLSKLINELKNVGATAIEINDERIVWNSSIEMVKNQVEINGNEIEAPYIIKATGNSNMINNGLTRPSGTIEVIKYYDPNIEINIKIEDKITIEKYNDIYVEGN